MGSKQDVSKQKADIDFLRIIQFKMSILKAHIRSCRLCAMCIRQNSEGWGVKGAAVATQVHQPVSSGVASLETTVRDRP